MKVGAPVGLNEFPVWIWFVSSESVYQFTFPPEVDRVRMIGLPAQNFREGLVITGGVVIISISAVVVIGALSPLIRSAGGIASNGFLSYGLQIFQFRMVISKISPATAPAGALIGQDTWLGPSAGMGMDMIGPETGGREFPMASVIW